MIVIDTSAVIAILLSEPGNGMLAEKMLAHDPKIISPVSMVEATMVLSRVYSEPKHAIDAYLRQADIKVHPIDADQTEWARTAFLLFGKGRHPARLNLGDCFSYAAAKSLDAPLLYVGNDFSLTDIRAA